MHARAGADRTWFPAVADALIRRPSAYLMIHLSGSTRTDISTSCTTRRLCADRYEIRQRQSDVGFGLRDDIHRITVVSFPNSAID